MTFQITTFYCKKCKQAQPHEMSDDGQKARCLICTDRQQALKYEADEFNDTTRHIAALDGMGNRGNGKVQTPAIMRNPPTSAKGEKR